MSPTRDGDVLIVDALKDVNRTVSGAVDVGSLRVYADRNGIRFRFVASRMRGQAFQKGGDRLSVSITAHRGSFAPKLCWVLRASLTKRIQR